MKRKEQKEAPERIQASPETGLSAAQAAARREAGLVNVSHEKTEKSTLRILADNTFTFFNTVLFLIAAVFIGFTVYLNATGRGDVAAANFGISKYVFLIPAVMNIAMGTYQEISSMKVIKKLRIVTESKARVIRDGQTEKLDAAEIVLDDVIAVFAGDQATADMEVLTGEVYVDESMLTGEADHVKKTPGDTILSGSAIIAGDARCRAVAIGDDTYAAALTRRVKSIGGPKSELMRSIMRLVKWNTVGLGVVLLVVFTTLILKIAATGGDPSVWDGMTLSLTDPATWSLIFLTGGSYGIGMIPSGLVLTASVAMMVSIAGLTKKNTLIQELYSLENLSRVDVICLDKTGTLTDGTMTVVDVKSFLPEEEVARHARFIVGTAGERNATMEAVFQRFGTEEEPDVAEKIPFSSANKYSGVVYHDGKKLLMGAPEYLLPQGDPALAYAEENAKLGRRVVAMTLDGKLCAFIAIEDHIRDSAPDTLRFFQENGVTVKVISGDNPLTVSKIAQNCGIKHADRYISLAGVPLEEIPALAEDYTVFARVSPEQKEALVKALQAKKHKVAMTGDGVNDILALRRADSSITFAKATEAAKSCSDVVLLDNDFSHLKEVVGEGRRVIGNIQKTATLYMMKSVAVFLFAFALIPFAKGQMWLSVENLYMLEAAVIGTGGFLLSLEPNRKPVTGSFMTNILSQALAAGVLAAFAVLLPLMTNLIPRAFGAAPFIADTNVRTMMTLLMTAAGMIVVFSMCLPFSRYRAIAMGLLMGTAGVLGFMLPASFLGGETVGAEMLAFDAAAGQSFFDCALMRQMFQPWNCPAIQNLFADRNNFVLIRIFLYGAVPVYILVRFAVENLARKNYGKDVKKNRAWRAARRMMLSSGFVLILHALLTATETVHFNTLPALLVSVAHLIIGYIGYKLWRDPTKKMIPVAAVSALALVALTVVTTLINRAAFLEAGSITAAVDAAVIPLFTLIYALGAAYVFARRDLGLDKKRDA